MLALYDAIVTLFQVVVVTTEVVQLNLLISKLIHAYCFCYMINLVTICMLFVESDVEYMQ